MSGELQIWLMAHPMRGNSSLAWCPGRPGAQEHLVVEAHDDEGEHELVEDARPQEVVVHDVAPHAILRSRACVRACRVGDQAIMRTVTKWWL